MTALSKSWYERLFEVILPARESPSRIIPVTKMGDELVQVVQNLPNSIPLVPGRPGVLRVYLDTAELDGKYEARLEVQIGGGAPETFRSSVDYRNHQGLHEQRSHASSSLNFYLPGELFRIDSAGQKEIDVTYNLSVTGLSDIAWSRTYELAENKGGVKLDLRIVGLRYRYDSSHLQTDATDEPHALSNRDAVAYYYPSWQAINVIQSLAYRALPVPGLEFSHVTIDAPRKFGPPFPQHRDSLDDFWKNMLIQYRCTNMLHGFLKALRTLEIEENSSGDFAGEFVQTYYCGLLDGPTENLRGAASEIPRPDDAEPPSLTPSAEDGDAKAEGPVFVGADSSKSQPTSNVVVSLADASGEYTLHELCHLLGGLHPGCPALDKVDECLDEMEKTFERESTERKPKLKRKYRDLLRQDWKASSIYTNQDKEGNQYYVIGNLCDRKLDRGQNSEFEYERDSVMGYDIGDRLVPASVKSHLSYFDIMSYRYNLWISNYNTQKFQRKLAQPIDALKKSPEGFRAYRIIGQYLDVDFNDEDRKSLLHVIPICYVAENAIEINESNTRVVKTEASSIPLPPIVLPFFDFVNPNIGFDFDDAVIKAILNALEHMLETLKITVRNNSGELLDKELQILRRVKPRSIGGPIQIPDSYAEWGVFERDLLIADDLELVSIEYIDSKQDIYSKGSDTEGSLNDKADKIRLVREPFETIDGFEVKFTDVPKDSRYVLLAKNAEVDDRWSAIAVESLQDNQSRNESSVSAYIDKSKFFKNKKTGKLDIRIILISGFERGEAERHLDYVKLF